MKRYAIRNSKLFEMEAFDSLKEKIMFPINKDEIVNPINKSLVKKYDYNVYLQNADNCDII